MRLAFIGNLQGDEILAKDIYESHGKVLLREGTRLKNSYINKLKNYGVYIVYVEDERLEDILQDKGLNRIKQSTVEDLGHIFNNLINGDKKAALKSLEVVENLVSYIMSKKDINVNLYEIKIYDDYTYIHCVDTCIMSIFLGISLGLNKEELKTLGMGAILHDIGKMKIDSNIINKRDPLTEYEYEEIKKHPIYGRDILSQTNLFDESVLYGVAEHHEREDGTGYPFGLKGNQISRLSKIITVCDVFTAVSTDRNYRRRFEPNEAYELILSGAGSRFDNTVIEKFKSTFSIYPLGSCVELSNGVEGFVIKQNKNLPSRPIIRVVYDSKTGKQILPYEIDLLKNINITIRNIVL